MLTAGGGVSLVSEQYGAEEDIRSRPHILCVNFFPEYVVHRKRNLRDEQGCSEARIV